MLHSRFQTLAFSFCLIVFIMLPGSTLNAGNDEISAGNISTAILNAENSGNILLNKSAVKFVRAYIRKNKESLVKIKQRSKQPFIAIDKVFKKYRLPLELKYLAVIESELKASALSNVGAAGPWQLMPSTAKLLGLKITSAADERTQYSASTKAAALYLRDLYREFDDWLLVIAAYNCGPRPVYAAIRKSGSRNFWKLQAYLPGESREHVKKFIATHYYFEGQGSVTTLTKSETIKHNSKVAQLSLQQHMNKYAVVKVLPLNEKAGIEKSIAYGL